MNNPTESEIHKITHAIIANELALNHNEAIKHTIFYKKGLKQKLNLLMPELYKAEKDFDEFFDTIEDSTKEVYNAYDEFIRTISGVKIWECRNISEIIKAYKKDAASIEGIVKKINKNVSGK